MADMSRIKTSWKEADRRQRLKPGTVSHRIMTALVLSGGEYPVKSLGLLMADSGGISRKVRELIGQGWIERKTNEAAGERVLRLKLFNRKRGEYMGFLFEGGEYYDIPDLSKAGGPVSRRKHELAEILMFFLTGKKINVTPDKIAVIQDGNGGLLMPEAEEEMAGEYGLPFFIGSVFAKKLVGEKVRANMSSRYNGMLVAVSGVYAVYNLRGRKLEWISLNESSARETMDRLREGYMPWSSGYIKAGESPLGIDGRNRFIKGGAIVYSHAYENFDHYFDSDRKQASGRDSCLRRLGDTYTNVYCIPMTLEGLMVTNMITCSRWHFRLIAQSVDPEDIVPDIRRTALDIDAELDDGTRVVCFTDCDIKRFHRVMEVADIESRQGKNTRYHVVCYGFQEEIVKKHIPVNATYEAVDINKVTEGFLRSLKEE